MLTIVARAPRTESRRGAALAPNKEDDSTKKGDKIGGRTPHLDEVLLLRAEWPSKGRLHQESFQGHHT